MLIDALLTFITYLLNTVTFLLPTAPDTPYSLPTGIVTGLQFVFETAQRWETFFPIQEMFVAALIVIGAEVLFLGWKITLFVLKLFRGN